MPGVGFELTIPVFERAKTFHTLDRAATVIGPRVNNGSKFELDISLFQKMLLLYHRAVGNMLLDRFEERLA
jgi:hypothetical protein